MFQVQICILLIVGIADVISAGYADVDYHAYPKYSFNYGVNDAYTGDVKQHTEHRDGDVVKGHYSLVEPDGSVRQVEYTADSVNGFNAVVLKSQPTVHATALKPVAIVSPAVPVPTALPLTSLPVKYVQSPGITYGQEHVGVVGVPYVNSALPYNSEHDAYNAFLHSRYYDYGHY